MHRLRLRTRWWFLALFCLPVIVVGQETYTLQNILDLTQAPEGVVIEIVTTDDSGLGWALPQAQTYVKQLH